MTNSRAKGARGEREARDKMREVLGCEARRGQQFSGGNESPDVVHNIDGLHIEVKRTESISLYKAMEQAKTDAGQAIPMVMHKRNRKEWLAVVRFDDLPRLAEIVCTHQEAQKGASKPRTENGGNDASYPDSTPHSPDQTPTAACLGRCKPQQPISDKTKTGEIE